MPMYDLNNFELFVCKEIMGSWTMCLTGIIERGWAYLDIQEYIETMSLKFVCPNSLKMFMLFRV